MKLLKLILLCGLLLALVACGGDRSDPATEETTTEETTTEEEAVEESTEEEMEETEEEGTTEAETAGVSCDGPVKVGLITDETGSLAIYGTHVLRSFPLGMEYATGDAGTEADGYTSYLLDNCEIQVFVRDDQSNPETTATVGRELIEVEGVDILIGTVSSGATASLQELARENDIIHIAAPAAANDLTGATFNENSFRTSRNNYQDAVNICQY